MPDSFELLFKKSRINSFLSAGILTEKFKLPFKLYHGSTELYDELRPTGSDFGNMFQKPGWSLFCWTKYEYGIGWAIFCVLRNIKLSGEYK